MATAVDGLDTWQPGFVRPASIGAWRDAGADALRRVGSAPAASEPAPVALATVAGRWAIGQADVEQALKERLIEVNLLSELGELIADATSEAPVEAVAQGQLRGQIDALLAALSERERRVLAMRFGLDDGQELTLDRVAAEFGVTRERIRQIEVKAIRKLRHPSRDLALAEYLV